MRSNYNWATTNLFSDSIDLPVWTVNANKSCNFWSLVTSFFHLAYVLKVCPCCISYHNLISVHCQIRWHCMVIPHFTGWFISSWVFGLFLHFGLLWITWLWTFCTWLFMDMYFLWSWQRPYNHNKAIVEQHHWRVCDWLESLQN